MLCIVDVDTSNQQQAADMVCALIELAMIRARREVLSTPRLYSSGCKYVRQNPEACAFRSPKDVLNRRGGDCKQLVLWRIAELRELDKEDAKPRIMWLNDKKGLRAHAQVRRANGDLEDPSLLLGMVAP